MENEKFKLQRTLLVVSFVCNNRCKLCGVLSPYYEKPPHFTAEELCRTVSLYFNTVSYVEKFTLSGGEPFLHPELASVVRHLRKYEHQFGKLEIITNGKLMMKSELERELVQLKKGQLLIDDYGINTKQCRKLEEQAKAAGIEVNYRIYYGKNAHMGGWFDMGDFSKRDRSAEETENVFRECGVTKKNHFGLFVVGTKGYVCFRSWRTMDTGLVSKEDCQDEYIDFASEESVEEKRKKIKGMQDREKAYGACYFCWGQGQGLRRYPAGEQI